LVATGWNKPVGSFVAAGRFGRGIEGARILTRRIGFGKGFGEVFLFFFADTDGACSDARREVAI
jgi:hypothetical protein